MNYREVLGIGGPKLRITKEYPQPDARVTSAGTIQLPSCRQAEPSRRDLGGPDGPAQPPAEGPLRRFEALAGLEQPELPGEVLGVVETLVDAGEPQIRDMVVLA